jgi:hypothetical protein
MPGERLEALRRARCLAAESEAIKWKNEETTATAMYGVALNDILND